RRVHERSTLSCMSVALPTLLALVLVGASFQVDTFQKSIGTAPASQTVPHGLGVTPKALVFWSAGGASAGIQTAALFSLGMTDGTATQCMGGGTSDGLATSASSRRLAPKAICFVGADQLILAEADFVSWSSSGFTLSWSTNDAVARPVHFLAIGGS